MNSRVYSVSLFELSVSLLHVTRPSLPLVVIENALLVYPFEMLQRKFSYKKRSKTRQQILNTLCLHNYQIIDLDLLIINKAR